VPRGMSCYADHQLADYPLKLVPLHLRTCDVVVATSVRIAGELQALADAPLTNVIVKANAIDTRRFAATRRAPAAGGPVRLIAVCRIEPKKGLVDLVEAVSLVRARGIDARLTVVGTPSPETPINLACADRLRERITQLGLADVVALPGRATAPEVRAHLAQADLFVAPFVETERGDKDGVPTSLLEAMATGLAVIATDAGSIPEVISHGVDGCLVPQRAPTALADAIAALARTPDERARLGDAARRTVRERFDTAVCEPTFHHAVRTAVARRNGRVR